MTHPAIGTPYNTKPFIEVRHGNISLQYHACERPDKQVSLTAVDSDGATHSFYINISDIRSLTKCGEDMSSACASALRKLTSQQELING